jgi:misacylated tRNA(Ala) deacylase
LPANNDRLRSPLEAAINDVISQDLPVRSAYVPAADAAAEPGVIRNRSVAPPPDADGLVRVVEIVGLDRQACGRTHLASTGRSRPIGIPRIDSKGRHNRPVYIGLVGVGAPAPS